MKHVYLKTVFSAYLRGTSKLFKLGLPQHSCHWGIGVISEDLNMNAKMAFSDYASAEI
jgi:hypothetical protein